jgi:hypothetical protein
MRISLCVIIGLTLIPAAYVQNPDPAQDLKIHAHQLWPYARVNPRLRDRSDAVRHVMRSSEELVWASPCRDEKGNDVSVRVDAESARALGVKAIDWNSTGSSWYRRAHKFQRSTRVLIKGVNTDGTAERVAWQLQKPGPDMGVSDAVIHPSAVALVERCEGPVRFVSNLPAAPLPQPGKP